MIVRLTLAAAASLTLIGFSVTAAFDTLGAALPTDWYRFEVFSRRIDRQYEWVLLDVERAAQVRLNVGDYRYAVWSADAEALALIQPEGTHYTLTIWPLRELRPRRYPLRELRPRRYPLHVALIYEPVAWSPDGHTLIIPADVNSPFSILPQFYTVDTRTGERIAFDVGTGSQTLPLWSPDGESLLYFHRTDVVEIRRLHLPSGELRTIPYDAYLSSYQWSPDNARIAYARVDEADNRSVYVMNADLSGSHQVTFGVSVSEFAWSPDGGSIAYLHLLGGVWTLSRIELATGERRDLLNSGTTLSGITWHRADALYVIGGQGSAPRMLIGLDAQGREFRRIALSQAFARRLGMSP
ncbi:MAG: hypothetical protein SF162_01435 [bacterium]|nr:hypothetical protein [bacterium]